MHNRVELVELMAYQVELYVLFHFDGSDHLVKDHHQSIVASIQKQKKVNLILRIKSILHCMVSFVNKHRNSNYYLVIYVYYYYRWLRHRLEYENEIHNFFRKYISNNMQKKKKKEQ